MGPVSELPAWQRLHSLAEPWRRCQLSDLFKSDPHRAVDFVLTDETLRLDFSRQAMDRDILRAMLELAEETQLVEDIERLFSGGLVNFTEGRPAAHLSARYATQSDCAAEAIAAAHLRRKMRDFATLFHSQHILGATGQPLKTIVHIGIGGSDLGPRLLVQALTAGKKPMVSLRFVSNIDPHDLDEALIDLEAKETLFIVSSKSFTTEETMANARRAHAWLEQALPSEGQAGLARHFLALTYNTAAAIEFGIQAENIFQLPAAVGGRFSLWSAVGLPAMLAAGPQNFEDFLRGGASMDQHFKATPLAQNMPVLMALMALWNSEFLGIESLAILPYAHALRTLPAYLQQLEMESNGKSVTHAGRPVTSHTAQIIWGAAGTHGQHAFYQLLYQGTRRCALDFILPQQGDHAQARTLLMHAQAQAMAFAAGRTLEEAVGLLQAEGKSAATIAALAPHYVIASRQPSTSLHFDRWDAFELGRLLALYEHKVFVLACLWGINSFDQFGVELGKDMTRRRAHAAST